MRRFSSLAWRSLLARPLRSALTVAGIALGVAVLFAALLAGTAMDDAVSRAASDELGRATLRVSTVREVGLTAETVRTIEQTPGVAVAAPAFERRTYLATGLSSGSSGSARPPVTVLGVDPAREVQLHDLTVVAGVGLAPGLERSALVSRTLADAEGLGPGDRVGLNGAAEPGPQGYEIVGVLAGDGPLPDAGGRVVVLPLRAAQALFGATGVTRVDVGTEGAPALEVMGRLEGRLQTEPYLLSTREDLAAELRVSTGDLRGTLLLVAAVVLFAGAFLIFNTLSMTVAERAREVGLLRAAGTTRRQVTELVLLQALALGAVGSALGVAAGLAGGALATAWVRPAAGIALGAPTVTPGAVATAFLIGVLVTLAAALEPAWRAARIPPVDALRRGAENRATRAARLRWLFVVFAALAVGALLAWPGGAAALGATPDGQGSGGPSGLVAPLAVYGLLLAAVLLLPFVLGPLLRLAGIPFRLLRGEERLARSSLARDPSRTALTAGALVVGLAMVVALGTTAENVRRIGLDWLAETIPGSEVVTSIRPIDEVEPYRADLAAVPGVERVSPIALFGAPLGHVRHDAAAVVGADLLADGRLSFTEGDRSAALTALDAGGSVVLPASLAEELGAHAGDTLEFGTGPTPARLKVAGIAAHTLPGASGESILVGWSDARGPFGVAGADLFAIRYRAGQEAAARPALESLARTYALEPAALDRVGGTVGDALERIFGLLDVLALAAILVAGLGVVNTLSMNVLERVREIGVLRATGMTSRQVWRMVVVEAGVLGLAGAVAGCVVGLVLGALLVAWSSGGELSLALPWQSIGLAASFGLAVTVAASIYPARLASRLSIVRAVTYE